MLKLAHIFQAHMMLQYGKKVRIWGNADAGAEVLVSFGGQTAAGTCDDRGNWEVFLDPLPLLKNQVLTVRSGDETLTISDVMTGEIWVAGGQSNMEFLMKYDENRYCEYEKAPNPELRFYDVPHLAFEGDDNPILHYGVWRSANAQDMDLFIAVGYYFALHIYETRHVPVGIVGCNWSGTTALTWTDRECLKNHPVLSKYWEEYCEAAAQTEDAEYEKQFRYAKKIIRDFDAKYLDTLMHGASWQWQQEQIERENQLPVLPMGKWDTNAPGNLYESMVKKIAGFAARGVIWYQGESDCFRPNDYAVLFSETIRTWRKAWKDELPFLYVQISPFYRWMFSDGFMYPEVRRQQELVMDMAEAAWMTTTTDNGGKWEIHPKCKKVVGDRLALLARGKVYGEDILCDPPKCVEAVFENDEICMYFENAGQGLYMIEETQDSLYAWYGDEYKSIRHLRCSDDKVIAKNPWTGHTPIRVTFMQEAYGECWIYNSAGIPLRPVDISVR